MRIILGKNPGDFDDSIRVATAADAKRVGATFAGDITERVVKAAESRLSLSPIDVKILEQTLNRNVGRVYAEAFRLIATVYVGTVYSRPGVTTSLKIYPMSEQLFSSIYGGVRRASRGSNAPAITGTGRKLRGAAERRLAAAASAMMEIRWEPLAHSTLRSKPPEHRDKFFVKTGALQQELTTLQKRGIPGQQLVRVTEMARASKQRFKTGRTYYRDTMGRFATPPSGVVNLDRIRIEVLPGVSNRLFAAQIDRTMQLEKFLGLSDESIMKLRNKSGAPHRALMLPVLSYYTRFEAPRVVAETVERFL